MKWHISTEFSTRPRIDDENGMPVASVFTRSVTDWDMKAQLIAAAPDLLEALRELEAAALPFGLLAQPVLNARAAIDKATRP